MSKPQFPMAIEDYVIVSSNKDKLAEYAGFGLPLKSRVGEDLEEPDGTVLDVISYKSRVNGVGTIVEDASLDVEGHDFGVNVKHLQDHLGTCAGSKAQAVVAIGLNDGEKVHVAIAKLDGMIVPDRSNGQAFGFDGYFLPDGHTETLYDLALRGEKHTVSPRKKAIEKVLRGDFDCAVSAENIGWDGPWQQQAPSASPHP